MLTDDGPGSCFDRGKLEPLTEIGKGGQGRVWSVNDTIRINRQWPVAYKEYDAAVLPGLDVDQLRRMVEFVPSLSAETGRWLCEQTAWPARTVCEAGRVRGFLMRRIPPDFTHQLPGVKGPSQVKPASFQFLLNDASYLARVSIAIDDRQRLMLLAALAETLDRFHALTIVVGDLSPNNLLFQLGAEPRCFFIDCDAMRLDGRSVLTQTETPDWEVPAGEELATVRSDAYKFGLVAVRLFAGDQVARDPDVLAAVLPELAGLARRSLSRDPWSRPRPAQWLPALRAAEGRPVAAAPTAANAVPAAVPGGGRAAAGAGPAPPPASSPQATPSGWVRPWAVTLTVLVLLMICGGVVIAGSGGSDDAAESGAGPQTVYDNGVDQATPALPRATPTVGIVRYDRVADHPHGRDIAVMLARWFEAINGRDWDTALASYDPAGVVDPTDPEHRAGYIDALTTTTDSDATLRAVSRSGGRTLAKLTFVSRQAAGYGPKRDPDETCTRWQLTLRLSYSDTYGYRILRPQAAKSSPC
ncbi:hypothetical protein [Micromonospora endophytica]|uniref:Uncharacterized protein n=1 Tax=Micromonospora endophytica TaxID=515350 RepID=A0A2W2CW14_9ACTN|nr:hypothetical protein [Micromonospora endophytica]PZF97504.1 hypothetical protein C1I93_11625 [Micromonospora endophytica]RIW45706.1 hypothetical protein D3H59_14840 [Micromonospora endophytica]BCJ62789.1 hypothetical protein Jiend_62110 [Micromonospora endophytica]